MSAIFNKIGVGLEKMGPSYQNFQNEVGRISTIDKVLNCKGLSVFTFYFPHCKIHAGEEILKDVTLVSKSFEGRMFEAAVKIKRLQIIETNLIKMKKTVEDYKTDSKEIRLETDPLKQNSIKTAENLLQRIKNSAATLSNTSEYKMYREGKEQERKFLLQSGMSACDNCVQYEEAFRRIRAQADRMPGTLILA